MSNNCHFGCLEQAEGLLKRDIEIDVDVEVDIRKVFWLFNGGFKLSSGTVQWYGSTSGTDFDISEIASPEVCAYLFLA